MNEDFNNCVNMTCWKTAAATVSDQSPLFDHCWFSDLNKTQKEEIFKVLIVVASMSQSHKASYVAISSSIPVFLHVKDLFD